MLRVAACLLATLFASGSASAQTAPDSVAMRFIEAQRAADWDAAVRLIHPETVAMIGGNSRQLLAMLQQALADSTERPFASGDELAYAVRMRDRLAAILPPGDDATAAAVALIAANAHQSARAYEARHSGVPRAFGAVPENDTTAHALVRLDATPTDDQQMVHVPMHRASGQWTVDVERADADVALDFLRFVSNNLIEVIGALVDEEPFDVDDRRSYEDAPGVDDE